MAVMMVMMIYVLYDLNLVEIMVVLKEECVLCRMMIDYLLNDVMVKHELMLNVFLVRVLVMIMNFFELNEDPKESLNDERRLSLKDLDDSP
jgi:hypothetical protein